jgi:hypothetical protein
MFRIDARKPVEFCDGLKRRDFLHTGPLISFPNFYSETRIREMLPLALFSGGAETIRTAYAGQRRAIGASDTEFQRQGRSRLETRERDIDTR